ncbi:hypothetical protein DHEL01_v209782 [Diaporthe helianthi]|uniref:Alternative oxidase n=1 Tax=Diaporthe helianthi TaxID=158607 RepID=A0A2P5HNJ2_DIAHE|nr:hypothetical protein DHEL01_v209782 [Diaporthe helianthi]
MYLPSSNSGILTKRYLSVIVLAVVIFLFVTSDSGPDLDRLRNQLTDLGIPGQKDGLTTRRQFVDRVLANDFYPTEYDGAAVRKLCSKAKWRDDRIVECNRLAGGIGNLKVNLLGCVRFAIEAGAILITPVFHPRRAFEKMADSFGWDIDLPISYVFDSDHFFDTLAEDCPQLHIVDDDDPAYNIPPKSETFVVEPKRLIHTLFGTVLEDPSLWRPAFDQRVEDIVAENQLPAPTSKHPIRLILDDVAFSWPVRYDGDEFRSDFGFVARYPRHIRELSARALYNLYKRLGIDQSPEGPSRGAFLGAHVRTEPDAQVEAWSSFEQQAAQIRQQVVDKQLGALYVATGTASDVDRLRDVLADVQVRVNDTHSAPVQVLQKWDILDEADIMILDELTWDQMALVDLDIMLRASFFVGIWESSWGWTISLRRHAWAQEDPYDYDKHPITFQDEYSILYGPVGAQPVIDPCLWL